MTERRVPRAFQQRPEATGEDTRDLPPVSPQLVEWLDREFPVHLSRRGYETEDQAEQRGQQQVIDRLRKISLNQE